MNEPSQRQNQGSGAVVWTSPRRDKLLKPAGSCCLLFRWSFWIQNQLIRLNSCDCAGLMIISPLAEPTKPPRQKQKGGRKEQVKAATSSRHCLTATPPPPPSLCPDRSSQNRKKNTNSCPRLSPPSELRWSS